MSTRYTSALFLFGALGAGAQVVYDLPGAVPSWGYSRYAQHYFDFDDLPVLPTTGTGVVWDLTGLELATTNAFHTCVDPASTPFGDLFPGATHAMGFVSQFQETSWRYYTLAGDSLFFNGQVWPPNVNPARQECTEPRLQAVFPFAYQDGWTDDATCAWDADPPATTTHQFELVATGTILFAGGSLTDVGMVHQQVAGEDYYLWYTPDNILQAVGNYLPGSNQIVLSPDITTDIEQATNVGTLMIQPSVVDDHVFVQYPGSGVGLFGAGVTPVVALISTSGQRIPVQATPADDNRLRLQLDQVAQGSYLVELRTARGTGHGRVIVAR